MRMHLLHAKCSGSLLSCLLLCLLLASGCVASQESLLPQDASVPMGSWSPQEPSLPQDRPLPPTPTLVAGKNVPFDEVARGGTGGQGCGVSNFPSDVVLIATSAEEYAPLWASIRPSPDDAIPNIEFAHDAAVVVVGACSPECRNVEVTHLIQMPDGSLAVYARQRIRPAVQGCEASINSTYDIVRTLKDNVPSTRSDVKLIVYEAYE